MKGREREAHLRKEAVAAKQTAEDGQRRVQELLYASDRFLAERALTESNLDHAEAILRGLSDAIQRKPDSPVMRLARAVVLQKTGNINEALDAFSNAFGMLKGKL